MRDLREARRREVLLHTILKAPNAWKLEQLPVDRWERDEEELHAALYPERQTVRRQPVGPQKSQWELYQELRDSGKLQRIRETRHERQAVGFGAIKDVREWLKSR